MANENQLQPIPEFDTFITKDDAGNVTTNWEEVARNLHGNARQYEGLSKRNYSDLEKLKKDPRFAEKQVDNANQNNASKPEVKQGFDYGQMAYLESKQIHEQDYEVVEEAMRSTGQDLKTVLQNKYLLATLKERAQQRETDNAIPEGGKRANSSTRDTVDYWIKKGSLPEDPALRTKVVNEKIARAKAAKSHPTVGDVVVQ